MAESGDRMAVLQLLQQGRLGPDQAARLLRALGEAGAGRAPDPEGEARALVVRLLAAERVDVEGALTLVQALAGASAGTGGGEGAGERLAVLRLLEEGRVGVGDAVSLLRALGDTGGRTGGAAGWQAGGPARGVFRRGAWEGLRAEVGPEQWERARRRAAERARRAAEFWSQQAEDVAERAGRAAEQVGENMGRMLSGLPDVVERMVRAGWGNWGPGHRLEESREEVLGTDGEATLDMEAWNGAVALRAVDGERVRLLLRKTVHAPSEEVARQVAEAVEAFLEPEGRRLRVGRRAGSAAWPGGLAIEAYLPRGVVWRGEVRTGNAPIELEGLAVRDLRLETSNGAVRVSSCRGEDLTVTTSNGRVEVAGALAGQTEVRTSNGAVVIAPNGEGGGEAAVRAVTSNGAIEVRLPPTVAVDLDLATSNGRIDLAGLGPEAPGPGNQKGFGRSEVRWRAPSWDQAAVRLRLVLRTSNGGIRVI
jgi:hypothetical protein